MPEAPQIRLLAKRLQPFVGRKIKKATALTDELDLKRLKGETIKSITVFGKQLLLTVSDFTIRVHLLMFGRVKVDERNEGGKLRLGLEFDDHELNFYACDIFFIDEPLKEFFDSTTDVMSPDWDSAKALVKLKEADDELISDALIDQEIFNGLGNKGVNEALYRSKVHPASKIEAIPSAKRKEIVKEAVDFSFDYLDWEEQGIAKDKFFVYKKKTCPVHATKLRHEQVGKNGRKCHFCDECQKLYEV